jgi:TRAP-type transport system periplasmic protein
MCRSALTGVIMAVCILAGCHHGASSLDSVVLTYASPYPASAPFSRADTEWMQFVERESNGRMRIKAYWGGALLSSTENTTEIRHGLVDIGMITPMYAKTTHLLRVQHAFYSGVRDIADQVSVYRCLAESYPELNGELSGLHVLAAQGGNFPGILTRDRPIHSLDDLKGLRLRAQDDTADVLRSLGADTVNMSMNEVYPAMAKGIIDGVVTPADALRSMHLAEVGKYFFSLRVPRGAYPARAMSGRLWEQLSAQDRALLDRAEAVWENALASELNKGLASGLSYARGQGVIVYPATLAEQQRFDVLYRDSSLQLAQSLQRVGIDGAAIAKRASWLVERQNAGLPLLCEPREPR